MSAEYFTIRAPFSVLMSLKLWRNYRREHLPRGRKTRSRTARCRLAKIRPGVLP